MVDVPKKAKAFGVKIRRKPNQKGAKASTRVILNAPLRIKLAEPRSCGNAFDARNTYAVLRIWLQPKSPIS